MQPDMLQPGHTSGSLPISLRPRAAWKAEGDREHASFGFSVGTAGDVNGDGYADVIVGASAYSNGQAFEGRAFVYHGSARGLPPIPNWTAESNQSSANLGNSVGTAGDVNGDGYDDVIVGAADYDNGQPHEGRAFAYYGSAAGLALLPDWTAESDQADAYFAMSVSTAGDVNGDGYADVIVGAPFYHTDQGNDGKVYAYYGSASGLSATPDWTVESDSPQVDFGYSVSTAGDVNGDGYADVIVGARSYSNGQGMEGKVFAYYGSASGLSATPDWTAESDKQTSQFGNSVNTAGDVNEDGYDDVIVGSWAYTNDQSDEGRAFAYYGSSSGLSTTADWTAESDQEDTLFGVDVGTAGDVNGDGYDDVIVGAAHYTNGQSSEGGAFAYYGSGSGLSPIATWKAESDQAGADFGWSAGTAGDVNRDGFADVIIGAFLLDHPETSEGGVVVFRGRATKDAWR